MFPWRFQCHIANHSQSLAYYHQPSLAPSPLPTPLLPSCHQSPRSNTSSSPSRDLVPLPPHARITPRGFPTCDLTYRSQAPRHAWVVAEVCSHDHAVSLGLVRQLARGTGRRGWFFWGGGMVRQAYDGKAEYEVGGVKCQVSLPIKACEYRIST